MRKAIKIDTGLSFLVQSFYVGVDNKEYYETTKEQDNKQLSYVQGPQTNYWDFISIPDEEVKIHVMGEDLEHVSPPQGCEWYDVIEKVDNKQLSVSARLRSLCRNNWGKER